MKHELNQIIARAHKLRMTEHELREAAGVTPIRYWRAKTGKVGPDAQVKVLRELERSLYAAELKSGKGR